MNENQIQHFADYVNNRLKFEEGCDDTLKNLYRDYDLFSKRCEEKPVSLFNFTEELLKLEGVSAELFIVWPPISDESSEHYFSKKLEKHITEEDFEELKIKRFANFVTIFGARVNYGYFNK